MALGSPARGQLLVINIQFSEYFSLSNTCTCAFLLLTENTSFPDNSQTLKWLFLNYQDWKGIGVVARPRPLQSPLRTE